MIRIGLWDKHDRRGFKRIKYKGICNDAERRSTKPIVGQITES